MPLFPSNLRTHHVQGAGKRPLLLAGLLLSGIVHAGLIEKDWCTITQPDSVVPGTPIEITVAIKPSAGSVVQGVQLSTHLQWAKQEGYGGFLNWHPGRDPKPGATYQFKFNPKLDLDKMTGVMPVVFLAPGGDFEKHTKFETLPVIPIKVAPKLLAKLDAEAKRSEARAAAIARPATATLKKSSLRIIPETKTVTKGDAFTVTVNYVLDPSDTWAEGTQIELVPLGPWVDNPDGKYTTTRAHQGYPGLDIKRVKIEPGKGSKTFSYTLGGTFRYNELQWMAMFIGGDGKAWPWSIRANGPSIGRFVEGFDLVVPSEGGLFTYAETPRVDLVWGGQFKAESPVDVTFRLINSKGETVSDFKQTVTVGTRGEKTPIALPTITERGVLLLLATIGDATRDVYFARIPDVAAVIGSRRTPFGVTNVTDPELSRVARRLGASYCRHFTGWNVLESLPGEWNFADLDKSVDANRAAGIIPWICLIRPPSWVITEGSHSAGFEPFSFNADAWGRSSAALASHYKGRIWGFEWLNEIVPGSQCKNPVAEYIDFCRIGTEAVRRIDPQMKVQLAGGLWPRNFRTDLLNSGIGSTIDVLPIHYGGDTSIREASHDIAAVGKSSSVSIWDNETARGLSVWNMPPTEALVRSVMQSKWILRQWPAELTAGAEAIIYFGGHTAAAGNWSYLLDRTTPRPIAATFAVLSAKIGLAEPIATAYVEPDAVLYIFEKDGQGLAVAGTISDADDATATLRIPAGSPFILKTDHQGNEQKIATEKGSLTAELGAMPVILEEFDLATLAVQAGLEIGTQGPGPKPTVTVVSGSAGAAITLRAVNPLKQPVKGSVAVTLESGVVFPIQAVDLAPGANALIPIPLATAKVPAGASLSGPGIAELRWTSPAAACKKSFTLVVFESNSLGNLLKNGDMEQITGTKPTSWGGKSESYNLSALGKGPGFEGSAVRFSGAQNANYQSISQSIKLPAPGQKYLYSAWVWNEDMQAGSNLSVDNKTYYIPAVFDAGQSTKFWRLLTHIRATPDSATSMSLTPVVHGKGWAMYDNIRVSLYDGTDFAAEAPRTTKKIVVDGSLDDWDLSDPIPLLCDNQITAQPGYAWTPQNLSGVAKFAWDADALYLAVWVRDDKHVANTTGEDTVKGDSLVVALHPENRADGTDAKAFQWYVGAASPGGGSGVHTLYRPALHSGGLQSGQLAKDSSVYEVSIKRTGDITAYELRIPWAETGGLTPSVGVKAGLSLQLIDKDDSAATGVMTWGGGLKPTWSPSGFGALTLIE